MKKAAIQVQRSIAIQDRSLVWTKFALVGTKLFGLSQNRSVLCLDLESSEQYTVPINHGEWIAASKDGRHLALSSADGLYMVDSLSGQKVFQWPGEFETCIFDGDDHLWAAMTRDGEVDILRLDIGVETAAQAYHLDRNQCNTGIHLLRRYPLEPGFLIQTYPHQSGRFYPLVFDKEFDEWEELDESCDHRFMNLHPGGHEFLTRANSQTVCRWDVPHLNCLGSVDVPDEKIGGQIGTLLYSGENSALLETSNCRLFGLDLVSGELTFEAVLNIPEGIRHSIRTIHWLDGSNFLSFHQESVGGLAQLVFWSLE